MLLGVRRQRCGDDLFLPLDVRGNGNAGRLDSVHDVDANAWTILDDLRGNVPSDVVSYDGGNDATVGAADVPETQRQCGSLCYMASGYFAIWLAAGVVLYALGMALVTVEMQSELISCAVPSVLGASLMVAGAFQFTRWKMTNLLRCRSPSGCAASCPQSETSFRLGCKQGMVCCICCASPMMMLFALGMMNPLVMIVVAIVIAAEKLLPRPEIVARVVGVAAVVLGILEFMEQIPMS